MNEDDCSNKILLTKTSNRLDLAHGLLPPIVASKLLQGSSHILLFVELVTVPRHSPLHYVSTICSLQIERILLSLHGFWDKKETNLELLGKTWDFMKMVTFEG